tara:strand:- start:30182 stop:31135 length:954 start_codon:yes stop_codon:yes gene_type:complete
VKERILITGGLGFIGGRLCEFLIEDGYSVYASTRKTKLTEGLDSRINLVKLDLEENDSNFEDLLNDIDIVIHAAGLDAHSCKEDPDKAFLINSEGTSKILEAAIHKKVKTFIFLSTIHVFSNSLIGKFSKNSPTINKHPYATSNLEGESLVMKASAENKINGIVLRLANVFGAPVRKEGECWNLFVNNICKELIISQKITLNSSEHIERNFLPMSALCNIILSIIKNKLNTPNKEALIVSSKESLSLLNMARRIQDRFYKITSLKSRIIKQDIDQDYKNHELVIKSDFVVEENLLNIELDNLIKYCLNNFPRNKEDE